MTDRPASERIKYRNNRGWYMDVRDYPDEITEHVLGVKAYKALGVRKEDDSGAAENKASDHLQDLKEAVKNGSSEDPVLDDYRKRHLQMKKSAGLAEKTLREYDRAIRRLLAWLTNRLDHIPRLSDLTVSRLSDYREWMQGRPGYGGSNLSQGTIAVEFSAISGLCSRAVSEDVMDRNPVSHMQDRPTPNTAKEVEWLEPDEAADLLFALEAMRADPKSKSYRYAPEALAALTLLGVRKGEGFGLRAEDINRDEGIVWIRENEHRGLKRDHHRRWVPLWPQLRELLDRHQRRTGIRSGLLFPAQDGGMLSTLRDSIRTACELVGIDKKVTHHTFRHTYAATRMQTIEQGAPVSPHTVMRELGHRNLKQIEERYGHLQRRPLRKEVVEYRVKPEDLKRLANSDEWSIRRLATERLEEAA